MGVSKKGAPFRSPYQKGHNTLGSILGPLFFGSSHIDPRDSWVSSFLVMTCFLIRGCNMLPKARRYGVSMASILGTVAMVWGRYLLFGYLDPLGRYQHRQRYGDI